MRTVGVAGKMRDPFAPLLLLAASLEEELRGQRTNLTVSLQRNFLTVAYDQIVVLHWRRVGSDLVCFPSGWCRKTYTALGSTKAREITLRLV
jgi:hypothetical protein